LPIWKDGRGGAWCGGYPPEAEDDDLLRSLGHGKARTGEGRRWFSQQVGSEETAMSMQELEGYDEVIRKLVATLPSRC
jgi:hypothetical protein